MNAPVQHQHTFDTLKHATDAAIASGALSSPIWLQYAKDGLGWFMLVGGAVLLAIRIYIAIIEACGKTKKAREHKEEK